MPERRPRTARVGRLPHPAAGSAGIQDVRVPRVHGDAGDAPADVGRADRFPERRRLRELGQRSCRAGPLRRERLDRRFAHRVRRAFLEPHRPRLVRGEPRRRRTVAARLLRTARQRLVDHRRGTWNRAPGSLGHSPLPRAHGRTLLAGHRVSSFRGAALVARRPGGPNDVGARSPGQRILPPAGRQRLPRSGRLQYARRPIARRRAYGRDRATRRTRPCSATGTPAAPFVARVPWQRKVYSTGLPPARSRAIVAPRWASGASQNWTTRG